MISIPSFSRAETVMLITTANCNIACSYCYVKKESEYNYMSLETAKKAIKAAYEGYQKSDGFKADKPFLVAFFGGEPLLDKQFIRDVVAFAKSHIGKNVAFDVSTNGILLDDDFLAFLVDEKFNIGISLDGIRENHNKYRCGSYDAVVAAIKKIHASGLFYEIKYCPFPDDFSTVFEGVKAIKELGVRRLLMWPVMDSGGWTQETADELVKQYNMISDWLLENVEADRMLEFQLQSWEIMMMRIIEGHHTRFQSCVLGKDKFSVNWNGDLILCQGFTTIPEGIIGHIDTGIDIEKVNGLYQDNTLMPPQCESCETNIFCSRQCPAAVFRQVGKFYEITPAYCLGQKAFLQAYQYWCARLMEKDWKSSRLQNQKLMLREVKRLNAGDQPNVSLIDELLRYNLGRPDFYAVVKEQTGKDVWDLVWIKNNPKNPVPGGIVEAKDLKSDELITIGNTYQARESDYSAAKGYTCDVGCQQSCSTYCSASCSTACPATCASACPNSCGAGGQDCDCGGQSCSGCMTCHGCDCADDCSASCGGGCSTKCMGGCSTECNTTCSVNCGTNCADSPQATRETAQTCEHHFWR